MKNKARVTLLFLLTITAASLYSEDQKEEIVFDDYVKPDYDLLVMAIGLKTERFNDRSFWGRSYTYMIQVGAYKAMAILLCFTR